MNKHDMPAAVAVDRAVKPLVWSGNQKPNAERAAVIANTAFREGYLQAQADIRKALGQ